VEIKCQTRCNRVFFLADLIACSTCFGHHYAYHQELKSVIQWFLSVVFRAVVFKLLDWCAADGYVSGLQDFAASSLICGNKMSTRCNRRFYCRSYCFLNMFRASLCPSSGALDYYTVVAACGISCCDFHVAGLVRS